MLSKRPEIESRLEAARDELATAEAALTKIAADEDAAAMGSAATHAAWRAKRDDAAGEIERLRKVIGMLGLEADERSRAQAEADWRQRRAEAVKRDAALEVRIPKDLERANEILIALMRDQAASDIENRAINAALPDLEPLVSPDFSARGRPALPRQDISRERIWLWCKVGTDYVVGDQSAVRDLGNGRGTYETGVTSFTCEARLFDKVEFNPPEAMQRPKSLYLMKLVRPDGTGFLFDGDLYSDPHAVRAALDALAAPAMPTKRPVEFELIPLPIAAGGDVDEKAEAGAA